MGTTNPDDACSINNNSDGVNHKQAGATPSPDGWWEVREVPTGGIYRKTADPLEANTSARSRWVWVASICDFFFFLVCFLFCFKLKGKLQPQRKEHVQQAGFPFISLNVLQIKSGIQSRSRPPQTHRSPSTALSTLDYSHLPTPLCHCGLRGCRLSTLQLPACPSRSRGSGFPAQGSPPGCVPGKVGWGLGGMEDGPWKLRCQFSKSKAKASSTNSTQQMESLKKTCTHV